MARLVDAWGDGAVGSEELVDGIAGVDSREGNHGD